MSGLRATVAVTYRCNAKCIMCGRHAAPSAPDDELDASALERLPRLSFVNVTGGEPFIREDLCDLVGVLRKRSGRVVISTNGFFTERITALCRRFPDVGVRVSLDGLEKTNNEIRGLPDGYVRALASIEELKAMGLKDLGLAVTVQDKNAAEVPALCSLAETMGIEFATTAVHNGFYFAQADNSVTAKAAAAAALEEVVNRQLVSRSPKDWFRAYYNHGLINYISGRERLLPCEVGNDSFFVGPEGDVCPCNGSGEKLVMGNINRMSWGELWHSSEAEAARRAVKACKRRCWMVCSASPAMHRHILVPALWAAAHKLKTGKKYSLSEAAPELNKTPPSR